MLSSVEEDTQQKVRSACEPCHERKIKCKQDLSGGPCVACSSSGRSCFFLPRIKAGRPRRNRSPKQPKSSPSTSTTPERNSNQVSDQRGRSWQNNAAHSEHSSITAALDWVNSSTDCCLHDGAQLLPDVGYSDTTFYPYDSSHDEPLFPDQRIPLPDSIALPNNDFHIHGIATPALSQSMTPSAASSIEQQGDNERDNRTSSMYIQRYGSVALPSPALGKEQELQSPWSPDSKSTGPSFLDLIRKCSELEMHIGSLESSRDMLFDPTTSAPTYKLHFLLQTISAASDLVMNVASKAPMSDGSSTAATSQAYQYFPEQPVDNISPAALERGYGQVTSARLIAIEPSLLALGLALAHKLLDVCELMVPVSPRETSSEVRMLYLKRLDAIVSRVRGGLSLIEEGICQDTLTRDGLMRASKIQSQMRATCSQIRHSSLGMY